MILFINDKTENAPSNSLNVKEMLEWKGIPAGGTAVAVNDHLVTARNWDSTTLKDGDRITIITAAFGG